MEWIFPREGSYLILFTAIFCWNWRNCHNCQLAERDLTGSWGPFNMGCMKSLLLAIFVALLMVGCGEETVDYYTLQDRNGTMYLPNEKTPFTGRSGSFYENGQKKLEINYKDGKKDGLWCIWLPNGQKWLESTYKDGERVED